MNDFKTQDNGIINEGSDLDTIKHAMQNKTMGSMTIQLGDDKGGWLGFLDTDIGKLISKDKGEYCQLFKASRKIYQRCIC